MAHNLAELRKMDKNIGVKNTFRYSFTFSEYKLKLQKLCLGMEGTKRVQGFNEWRKTAKNV